MSEYIVAEKTGAAIQSAIDAAAAVGGGRVCLEPGLYLSGTLYLKSNIELHLPAGAILKGFSKPELYDDFCDPGFDAVAPEKSRKCLLAAAHAENVSITGQGEVNGSGPDFYDRNVPEGAFFAKPPHPRPRMLQFYDCRNLLFEGVSFVDSPGWTFWLLGCEDVHISRVRVVGCQQMINNDGIDIDDCRRVSVSDSFFRTGDDCLILRAIRRTPEHHAVCEEVVVSNCVLDSRCQGIRIGCPSDDTIRCCTFSNIIIRGAGNGININNPVRYLRKDCSGYLHLENLIFQNFIIESGRVPVWINVENTVRLRYIGSMSFSNFRIRSPQPIRLEGNAETWLEDLRFSDIKVETCGHTALTSEYVRRLTLNQVELCQNSQN
ncbi:MAG: glycosyl hydrolase family 28 protein [Lentisphaeria bacterium]